MKVGCYNCGEIDGEVLEDDLGRNICGRCHSRSIVDFVTMLDLLMEVHREGNMPQYLDEYLDEVVIE